jgi:hypothetical protein
MIHCMLALLILASSAQAQTGNWQAVENIKPGSRISVKAEHRVRCIFRYATDDELVCKRIHRGLFRSAPPEIAFDRPSVREVRLEKSDEANAAVGAAIGAGVGAAAGASNGNGTLTRGGGALLLGALGAVIGWSFGSEFHVLHGKIVYKQ